MRDFSFDSEKDLFARIANICFLFSPNTILNQLMYVKFFQQCVRCLEICVGGLYVYEVCAGGLEK